jgi:hypothetical protein
LERKIQSYAFNRWVNLSERRWVNLTERYSLGPDGRQIAEFDGPSGAQGPVPVAVAAKSSGTYLFGVLSFNKNTASGKYEAKIEELLTAAQYKARLAEEAAKKKVE